MQPRRLLAFFVTSPHCWLVFNSPFTRTSRSFLAKLLANLSVLSTSLLPGCWTWHFFWLNVVMFLSANSPVCQGPCEPRCTHLIYQPLLSDLYSPKPADHALHPATSRSLMKMLRVSVPVAHY